ncbi:hypothetical protein CDAR_96561 [Caerostris darwini]|uniref:Uncharacterized protein n=1 Tax=Caerostris darwini TaxID=1538125 RepID=A0AAV4QSJ7_9ARAC|nr:hypothetical protein CDAR_96561 [Caerostris darwini]
MREEWFSRKYCSIVFRKRNSHSERGQIKQDFPRMHRTFEFECALLAIVCWGDREEQCKFQGTRNVRFRKARTLQAHNGTEKWEWELLR